MQVEASVHVAVPPEAAWAWWTDYGPEGSVHRVGHGLGASERRVVEASPGRVVLEERLPIPFVRNPRLLRHEVHVNAERRCLLERGMDGAYESTWWFDPADGGGTRIRRLLKIRSNGLAWLAPVARPVARALVRRDLAHHARELVDGQR